MRDTGFGFVQFLGLLATALLGAGCSGPNTPLGAVNWVVPETSAIADTGRAPAAVRQEATPYAPKVLFFPSQQVLHQDTPLKIVIRDHFGSVDDYELSVHYNGLDISRRFLASAKVREDSDRNEIRIQVPRVRLAPQREHVIEFNYRSRSGSSAFIRYEPPSCQAFRAADVLDTGRFRPSNRMLSLIQRHSRAQGFNPSFLTGLIAQESGFNPRAVSWARALGLTQITPIAETEVAREFPQWPRYRKLGRMPATVTRAMVLAGKVKATNEWRLDPEKSIQGGLVFVRKLAEAWSTPEQLEFLRETFPDPEMEHTKLILASYHSGYSRVQNALRKRGEEWIDAPNLNEARKYVNMVTSYCHHFAEKPASAADFEQEETAQ